MKLTIYKVIGDRGWQYVASNANKKWIYRENRRKYISKVTVTPIGKLEMKLKDLIDLEGIPCDGLRVQIKGFSDMVKRNESGVLVPKKNI